MPARRSSGLTAEAVEELRARIAEGKRPRVRFSGPQFPDGAAGTVVRIGDPAVAGTDYITVRVTVNGVADELAFAPAELQLPGSRSTDKATRSAPEAAARPTKPKPNRRTPITPASTRTEKPKPAPKPEAAKAATAPPAPKPEPAKAAATPPAPRRGRKAAAPSITVSVSSSGAAWTVSASRGARSIAKGIAVPPGVVSAIAELLDQPAVTDAVAEVNESALAEAEARASLLRAELAELDAVLAAHRKPR